MRNFQAIARVNFENAPGSELNTEIVGRLRNLDAKAAELRSQAKNPRAELAAEIHELRSAAGIAYHEQAKAYRDVVTEGRQEWEAKRDRKATADLARLERARNRIAAMSDKDAKSAANAYIEEREDLDLYELRELAARITSDESLHSELNETMQSRYADRPWLAEDPDLLAHEAAATTLEGTPPGSVAFDMEGILTAVDIEALVDFEGELDA